MWRFKSRYNIFTLIQIRACSTKRMHLFNRFLNYLDLIVCGIYSESPTVGIRIDSDANLVLNYDANEIFNFRSFSNDLNELSKNDG